MVRKGKVRTLLVVNALLARKHDGTFEVSRQFLFIQKESDSGHRQINARSTTIRNERSQSLKGRDNKNRGNDRNLNKEER